MKATSMGSAYPEALGDLLVKGAQLGRAMLEAVAGPGGAVGEAITRSARRTLMGSCHIPEPCWMPQPLGEVVSHVCGGGNATMRISVTNCNAHASSVQAAVTGASGVVTVEPKDLQLGPMEEGILTISLQVPEGMGKGESAKAIVWVRGCKEHYLRWTVKTSALASDSVHEVEVQDCPDLIHHWYDHFYRARSCRHGREAAIHHG